MELEFFKMRVESVREAAARGRWIFATGTIVAVAIITAIFNQICSWIRNFPFDGKPYPLNPRAFPPDAIVTELQKDLLRNWVDSQFVNIPLFGMKFSATDASVLGSLLLTNLSVWLFYSMRRENHLIGQTMREAKDHSPEIRAYVYLGISATQVFATVSENDQPISNLDGDGRHNPTAIAKGVFRILVYLPAIAILLVIGSDGVTWIMPSSFRFPHVSVNTIAYGTHLW